MASGTRLARLKMLEDDNVSKRKTRKLAKLNAPSPLQKKLGSTGKKIPESPLRRSVRTERVESATTNTNSKKHASSIMSKNRKLDENIGPSSPSDKPKKSASPQTKKRKVVGRSVSSSIEDFTVSASPQNKKRKVNGKNIVLGANDTKGEDGGKKTIRKHLDVRTYKKLVKGQASKCGSRGGSDLCLQENSPLRVFLSDLGANISKSQEVGDRKRDVHDEGDAGAETIEPLGKEDFKKTERLASNLETHSLRDEVNQDNETNSSGFKDRKRIPCDILVEASGKETPHHESCVMNIESSSPIIEELGVNDIEARYDDCTGKNSNIDSKEFSIHSQAVVALIPNICLVCKQSGQLMSCFGKGCKRSYHLSCLDRLLPGAWLCKFCVKKKLESGVYSVSEGIESVWDIDEGVQSGKHYFVKYKGLSHSHNRWIPESQLLHDAPSLLAKFRKKGQKEKVTKWRKEWVEPERLLQKRLVVLPETADEYTSGSSMESSNCCIEWFVKWKGLEYDQATWELEKSLLLGSSEAARLVEDYGHRLEQAKRLHDPLRREKVLRVKKDPFYQLTELPDGCPTELGNDLLGSLNRLREFWHKSVNAVLIDDQERFPKSILFVLSLQCYACQPSLIITTTGSLPLWQAEFGRLAPSLNVVMYEGDKDVRKMIRNLEFYEESGCLMFQVLLADHEAIIEDIGDINCIGWEVVIIDKCQNSKMFRYLEQLKSLNADFKLLLFNGQMKDSLSEYCILLSFLGRGGTVDDDLTGLKADANEAPAALATVKEKLAHHIAYERKADSSSFVEYWVPVPLSNVQLEQYCATLISNSNVLRSNSKSDVVGALHSILITTRKCCDHPYLVDGELRGLLTKGLQTVEFLNAEVRASGKLFLLDKILQEMKSRGLRVVILFQSLGGPGKISLGDILDDFLQQRFGVDSYERIETGLVMTKKVAALKMFNNKESGRFVFLIEKRACLPSVKLRFVDAVILFDSDWNPLNDLRSLLKISIESQQNCLKIFRLYTSFTVEEKLLMFAKQDTILDGNIESISRNITHSLLGWGASYLFRKLDQFHASTSTTCISEPSFDKICLNDVILEILTEFPGKVEITRTVPHSILMMAHQSGATYSGNIVLVGEKEGSSLPDKDMPLFWPGLLEGRYRRWIHISDRSQRIRRKVHNFDGFVKRNEAESEMKKKRRKTNIVNTVTSLECSQEKRVSSKDGCPNTTDISDAQKSCIVECEDREPKLEEQRILLSLLRPELSKLCDILELPASVKGKAQDFLVYIMNNHDVCSKQVTVLQALKISLCWRAASLLRHKLDRIESLVTAKKHLQYECTEEEAYSVYSRLRILKEKFSCRAGVLDNLTVLESLDNQSSGLKRTDSGRKPLPGKAKEIAVSDISGLIMTGGAPDGYKSSEKLISPKQGHLIHGTPIKFQLNVEPVENKLLKNLIDSIEKVSLRRSEDLSHKHQAEVLHFEKQMYEERVQLEKAHGLDLEFVRLIHIDLTNINGKINLLTQEFSSKMGRFYQHLKQQKVKLLSMQLDTRNKEQELKHNWLVKAKTGQLEESFDNLPLLETGFRVEKFKEASKYSGNCTESGTIILDSVHPSDGMNAELIKASTGESNESEECCHEVTSNILSGSAENIRLSDEALASQSVMSNNTRPIEHSRSSVEPSILPGPASVLSMNAENLTPQLEVLNQCNSRQTNLVDDSIMSISIDAGNQEVRNNSNILRVVPNPGLNQGHLLSSVQGLASSVAASTLSSVQEFFTNEHGRPAAAASHEVTIPRSNSIVSLPPPVELMCCNDAAPSSFISRRPAIAEHEVDRLPPVGYQETACSGPYCSFGQTGVPTQQTIIEPPILQIPEGTSHPRKSQDFLSERTSSIYLRGTGIQQVEGCAESLSSARHAVFPAQHRVLGTVVENVPSNQQITVNTLHPSSSQEDLPSERAPSTGVQLDQGNQLFPNFMSVGWVPPHAVYADPFQNELFRIRKQNDSCTKKHEDKKVRLQFECELEIEKLRRKYDALLQDAEKEHLRDKKMFQAIYEKVFLHKVFAEEVRSKFYDHKEGVSTLFRGPGLNLSQQLQTSLSQPQLPFRPSSVPPSIPPSITSSHPASLTINQESTSPLLATIKPRTRVPALAPIHSTGSSSQASPVFLSNTARGSTPRASLQVGRSPAPHLQRFRPNASVPTSSISLTPATSQQPLRASTTASSVDLVSALPAALLSTRPSISPACWNSQPMNSGSSPLFSSSPIDHLTQDMETDLLESLLLNLPGMSNEFPTSSVIDLRSNASPDIICLSDDD